MQQKNSVHSVPVLNLYVFGKTSSDAGSVTSTRKATKLLDTVSGGSSQVMFPNCNVVFTTAATFGIEGKTISASFHEEVAVSNTIMRMDTERALELKPSTLNSEGDQLNESSTDDGYRVSFTLREGSS